MSPTIHEDYSWVGSEADFIQWLGLRTGGVPKGSSDQNKCKYANPNPLLPRFSRTDFFLSKLFLAFAIFPTHTASLFLYLK
jgi:hypothetical protein